MCFAITKLGYAEYERRLETYLVYRVPHKPTPSRWVERHLTGQAVTEVRGCAGGGGGPLPTLLKQGREPLAAVAIRGLRRRLAR